MSLHFQFNDRARLLQGRQVGKLAGELLLGNHPQVLLFVVEHRNQGQFQPGEKLNHFINMLIFIYKRLLKRQVVVPNRFIGIVQITITDINALVYDRLMLYPGMGNIYCSRSSSMATAVGTLASSQFAGITLLVRS